MESGSYCNSTNWTGPFWQCPVVQPNQAQKHRLPIADIPFRMPGLRHSKFRAFLTSKQTGVAEQQSKTRENLNVFNLAYQMEYLLRENVASEPDMPVMIYLKKYDVYARNMYRV